MTTVAEHLVKWADKIDSRMGPISGADADSVADLLRGAGKEIKRLQDELTIAKAINVRSGEMLDRAMATLKKVGHFHDRA